MGKDIIVCFDGTGKRLGSKSKTNIALIHQLLSERNQAEEHLYLPGVGTLECYKGSWLAREWKRILGMAFGYGLSNEVRVAYQYVAERYQEGDRVSIFGFSRGAFAARVLAGMIHKCGLIEQADDAKVKSVFRMYRRFLNNRSSAKFKSKHSRAVAVDFLGLFDTVSSVGWIWSPVHFPYTANNPSVKVVRHALSTDERRAFFRAKHWRGTESTDAKEVWFAGVHADVGGAYPHRASRSPLSDVSLEWLLSETLKQGIHFEVAKAAQLLQDCDYAAPTHKSLRGLWWINEFVPKWVDVPPGKGFSWVPRNKEGWGGCLTMNLGRRRPVSNNATLHKTMELRVESLPNYRPSNVVDPQGEIPDSMGIEPLERFENAVHETSANQNAAVRT